MTTTPPDSSRRSVLLEREFTALRVLADLLAFVAAFSLSYQVYWWSIVRGVLDRYPPAPEPYISIAVVFSLVSAAVFWQQGLYQRRATVLNLWELETAIRSVLLAAALLFALLFFLDLETYSRLVVVGAILLTTVLVVLERRVLSALVRRLQIGGRFGRRTLIYGCDQTGQLLMKKVVQSPHLGSTVIGFLDDHVPVGSYVCCRISQTETTLFKAPVLGRLEGLDGLIEEHHANELLVAGPAVSPERLREILQVCSARGLTVGVVPNLGDIRSDQLRVEDLSAIPVLRPHQGSTRGLGLAAKRLFDQLGALALVGATAPIWMLAAFLIHLDSRGPVLFAQERIGRDGRPFRMFKFRTMRQDSEPYATSPAHDIDPRITRIGRYLRMGGVDELPQLINILRGDMSLVGPRPEMPYIVAKYSSLERQRLRVRPGITGLWQLSADRHAQIHENIEYDLYYVNHQSFLLDLLILLETVFFTAGLLVGSLDRRTLVRDTETETMPARSLLTDEPCILVALDQRRNGTLPESWATCIAAAYAVSHRWPVRIVVADGNIAALDALLAEPMSRLGTEPYRTAYVPYRSRTELRALTLGARLVLTDLTHVIAWAQEAGIDALEVGPGGARWWPQARVPDPIVTELSQVLTVYVAPPTGVHVATPPGAAEAMGDGPAPGQVVRLASSGGS